MAAAWAVSQGMMGLGSAGSGAGSCGAAGSEEVKRWTPWPPVGGVDEDAGEGAGAVGDLDALVVEGLLRLWGRGVGFGRPGGGEVGAAGEDDVEAAGGEEGFEAVGEGEVEVFFEDVAGDSGAVVDAAVGGVEDDGVEVEERLVGFGDAGFGFAGYGEGYVARGGGGFGVGWGWVLGVEGGGCEEQGEGRVKEAGIHGWAGFDCSGSGRWNHSWHETKAPWMGDVGVCRGERQMRRFWLRQNDDGGV